MGGWVLNLDHLSFEGSLVAGGSVQVLGFNVKVQVSGSVEGLLFVGLDLVAEGGVGRVEGLEGGGHSDHDEEGEEGPEGEDKLPVGVHPVLQGVEVLADGCHHIIVLAATQD